MFSSLMSAIDNAVASVECAATCTKASVGNALNEYKYTDYSSKKKKKKTKKIIIETLNINVDADGKFTGMDGVSRDANGLASTFSFDSTILPNNISSTVFDNAYATVMSNMNEYTLEVFCNLLAHIGFDPEDMKFKAYPQLEDKIFNVARKADNKGFDYDDILEKSYKQYYTTNPRSAIQSVIQVQPIVPTDQEPQEAFTVEESMGQYPIVETITV